MNLIYNGTDITDSVTIAGCVHNDAASGRSDMTELTLERAAKWYAWMPQTDDEIVIEDERFTTGKLFLNAVIPDGEQFRFLASSLPMAAAMKLWKFYRAKTVAELFDEAAAEMRMTAKVYGTKDHALNACVLRRNEGAAAFLQRVGEWEGLCVKAYDGAIRGVYVPFAQEQEPIFEVTVTDKTEGIRYIRQERRKLSGMTVATPFARATARDKGAKGNNTAIVTNVPATDNEQAGRWARGMLLMHNRSAETLEMEMGFTPEVKALCRIDIAGNTDMTGKWLCENARHDLINRTTEATLVRVIDTVR